MKFMLWLLFFFFKQKTAYEVRISDWSSDVCSSDLSSPTKNGSARKNSIASRRRPSAFAKLERDSASAMPKPADPHTVPHQATAERRRPRPRTVDLTAAVAETSAVAALAGPIDDGRAPHHHPRRCSGLPEWFERRCCRL